MLALALPVAIGAGVVIYRALTDDASDDAAVVVERPLIPPFGSVAFRVGAGSDEYCALLASTDEAREQGMQRRDNLGGYDAMVFAFAQDSTVSFINHNVPVDLQIGWYDANGNFVDGTTMEKCPDGIDCPTYGSRDPYRFAIEALGGGLDRLGAYGEGASVNLGGSCS